MRRKSERNKAKGSPEKKIEKPTRKSMRRRKKSPSTSPSKQDNFVEDAPESTAPLKEIEKETSVQTRLQSKELEQTPHGHEEKVSSTEKDVKADSPENEEDNGGSVWKVARADASPGEIQKLKLCRQRNTSEASSDTASSSRKSVKSSSKWQESGEGVAEEADSADEQLVSCTRMLSSTEQPNDPSSSYPGQDSNEEVSDSKEILPETTSVNLLSDDKPNIDQHGESNEANCAAQIIDSESGSTKPGSTTTALTPSADSDYLCEKPAAAVTVQEEKSVEDINEKSTEIFSHETNVENVHKDTSSEDEEDDKAKTHRPVDSSSDSNDESRPKRRTSSDRTSPRAIRRKHRNKYGDSSNSDTPDSEDETVDSKVSKPYVEEEEEEEDEKPTTEYSQENDKERSVSPERTNSHSNNVEKMEVEQCETVQDKSEENTTEKSEQTAPVGTQTIAHKPVKVNLKRSFSTRILSEKNEMKRDDTDTNVDNESNSQNKENGNEQEPKCVPRKRRWGTALSTDTAPSFSISTDSLKALVPGAKPLSINEVRLSKDDDEDKDRHRSNDKRHNSNDSTNDNKITDENLQKNGTAKKGNGKTDNHIATRRKISIVKEMPHIKSPSPPTSKPTNILLIKNLVRPFTLNQIKELLSRTGTIVENGFWMDRIKSKCIVEYSNEDQAFETRQALHGISWPMSNPKKLHVEYATKEDMEAARESSKEQPVARKAEPLSSDPWQQDWSRDEKINTTKVTVVREWDLGKEDGQQHIREKEREKKEHDKKRRARSRSPALDAHLSAPARKFKKKEDDPPPAKLLDDLFRKTKATPCIYWLPLTNEQIVVKEEMRRQHMAEHARRLEEMRRADRNRDGRRRRSPRK
ncbi:Apoptotic chromatin condensation inducer in the nucleus [Camponotus floridanus]|uniref:Apoptotic chromatin condensation inducer in the nucleus n=1 Tax=Camponotus floridanus TaxID=104421 RepID=E1ZWY7_CAMFO|nr:apoptotic chromatin condensation inducer in the nucleus [Camponotus floridanus]XP_011257524.1 apoptotic chromatin condensation inducer in the nucleus [Camponotus floridanus]EFN74327.1 Apoptotic chromatin condensation inducer in the nucleus [Camponotus floridanus]